MKLKITLEIDSDFVRDIILSAKIGDWAREYSFSTSNPWKWWVATQDDATSIYHFDIEKAYKLALQSYPALLDPISALNHNANEAADIWIQLGCFGVVKYG
jgi:hypothetical protein